MLSDKQRSFSFRLETSPLYLYLPFTIPTWRNVREIILALQLTNFGQQERYVQPYYVIMPSIRTCLSYFNVGGLRLRRKDSSITLQYYPHTLISFHYGLFANWIGGMFPFTLLICSEFKNLHI
jgi:hypothetical protein